MHGGQAGLCAFTPTEQKCCMCEPTDNPTVSPTMTPTVAYIQLTDETHCDEAHSLVDDCEDIAVHLGLSFSSDFTPSAFLPNGCVHDKNNNIFLIHVIIGVWFHQFLAL